MCHNLHTKKMLVTYFIYTISVIFKGNNPETAYWNKILIQALSDLHFKVELLTPYG